MTQRGKHNANKKAYKATKTQDANKRGQRKQTNKQTNMYRKEERFNPMGEKASGKANKNHAALAIVSNSVAGLKFGIINSV